MNPKWILSCSLVATALAGCWSPASEENKPGRQGMWAGDTIRAASLNKAIVRQRVIYPYHFVTDTAQLNPLGVRDLTVLAAYYLEHAGTLSVRRSGAAQSLYDARVQSVYDQLAAAGVARERITIGDTWPGGVGISSERLVKILREDPQLSEGSTSDSGSSSMTSVSTSSSQ